MTFGTRMIIKSLYINLKNYKKKNGEEYLVKKSLVFSGTQVTFEKVDQLFLKFLFNL